MFIVYGYILNTSLFYTITINTISNLPKINNLQSNYKEKDCVYSDNASDITRSNCK